MDIYDPATMSNWEFFGALAIAAVVLWYILRVTRKADRRHLGHQPVQSKAASQTTRPPERKGSR